MFIKNLKLTPAIVCFLLGFNAFAQTKTSSLGLPGDNFDLYGALELFQKADTPENFEKAINANANEVNNLDLDGDGETDYVRVVVKKENNVHTLVLQVAVSASEIQDIAVIEVEKTGHENTHVRIVGDEALYGKNAITESEDKTEVVAAEKTVSGTEYDESDDDVYATSDKSGYTYIDLQTIEPVATKIGHGVGYFMVDIMGPILKDALHDMFKSMIEEAIPFLKTD